MSKNGEYILSKYQEIDLIAETDKNKVFLVKDNVTGKLLVKKQLPLDSNIDIYKKLVNKDTKDLPKVHFVISDDKNNYVFEDYVSGTNLTDKLEKEKSFNHKQVIEWTLMLCNLLNVLHENDPPIIHRDIKPSNIIISDDGILKLIDFDISREYKENADADTAYIGTKKYASPEQYGFSQTDCRSDIYSVGIMMAELLTGGTPQNDQNFNSYGVLEKVIKKCIEVDPRQRYQNVDELKKALHRVNAPFYKKPSVIAGAIACACVIAASPFIFNSLRGMIDDYGSFYTAYSSSMSTSSATGIVYESLSEHVGSFQFGGEGIVGTIADAHAENEQANGSEYGIGSSEEEQTSGGASMLNGANESDDDNLSGDSSSELNAYDPAENNPLSEQDAQSPADDSPLEQEIQSPLPPNEGEPSEGGDLPETGQVDQDAQIDAINPFGQEQLEQYQQDQIDEQLPQAHVGGLLDNGFPDLRGVQSHCIDIHNMVINNPAVRREMQTILGKNYDFFMRNISDSLSDGRGSGASTVWNFEGTHNFRRYGLANANFSIIEVDGVRAFRTWVVARGENSENSRMVVTENGNIYLILHRDGRVYYFTNDANRVSFAHLRILDSLNNPIVFANAPSNVNLQQGDNVFVMGNNTVTVSLNGSEISFEFTANSPWGDEAVSFSDRLELNGTYAFINDRESGLTAHFNFTGNFLYLHVRVRSLDTSPFEPFGGIYRRR